MEFFQRFIQAGNCVLHRLRVVLQPRHDAADVVHHPLDITARLGVLLDTASIALFIKLASRRSSFLQSEEPTRIWNVMHMKLLTEKH